LFIPIPLSTPPLFPFWERVAWRGAAPVVFFCLFHSSPPCVCEDEEAKTHPDDNIFFLEKDSIKNVALAPCYVCRKGAVTWRNVLPHFEALLLHFL
jgi:hypothetical protein